MVDYGSGGWGFESLAARHLAARHHHCIRYPSLPMHGPLSTARNLCRQPVTRKRTNFG